MTCDYAAAYELEFRRPNPLRRAAALAVWTGLFLVQPRLALDIWRERRS
jgi:hypothetical protein